MKDKQIPTLHPSLSKLMHKVYANPELFTSEAYNIMEQYRHGFDNVTLEHGSVVAGMLPGDLKLWSLQ